jgi:hypothetical protein
MASVQIVRFGTSGTELFFSTILRSHSLRNSANTEPRLGYALLNLILSQNESLRCAVSYGGARPEGAGGAAEVVGLLPNTLRIRMKKLGIGRKTHEIA